MTKKEKLWQHLPALLIDGPTTGNDPIYQKRRRQITQASSDPVFNSKFDRLVFALTEIDIYFDEKGELRTRRVQRT